ncbi:hypothetical protein HPC49_52515 [Pyxidicoccus fallax]|uniref:Uncharacterized protein n=1 Tax=Pyxidicoccus fallax TaxID=394095 RepID=A0A848LUU9_9BACT|nr:hypothetical protein [Pyxidicoccus fallax]NMO21253.1 hypothetical protein [Pyxidicoccus fallax]NPC86797.1 hypothetical protein [Pyxidicoccus fallax]
MRRLDSQTDVNQFIPPAGQVDFPDDPTAQQALGQQWTVNLTGFTQQGITGDPWNATNSANNIWYFNPLTTDTKGYGYAPIQWNAFPGRLAYYYGGGGGSNSQNLKLPDVDLLALADTGRTTTGTPFANLPTITNPCTGAVTPYGPYGPRGWQDEYCEWSVQRDAKNNIVRIDFTCENPEYWNTLWMIDPKRVLALYQQILGKPQILLEDLYLLDPVSSQPVIDPSTNRPAYNPLNKWNSGPVSTATQGGAIHLTSTPNTLQTEIGLASAATVPRTVGNSNAQTLICCAQYGQPARNSDPHIGLSVNQLVAPQDPAQAANKVTLANPPGLYIQMPDFSGYKTPDNTPASEFWTIVRGTPSLTDANGVQLPGNYILHATFEVPASKGYTVSDITINGQKIQWAGQVARTFFMQITGMGLPQQSAAPVQSCVGTPGTELAQPLQLFHAAVFNAFIKTNVPNVMGMQMSLASNSTLIAPIVKQGQSNIPMVMTADTVSGSGLPSVSATQGLTVKVTGMTQATYAVPGNSYPGEVFVLQLQVSVAADAPLGLQGLWLTNAGQQKSKEPFPAALNVVAA